MKQNFEQPSPRLILNKQEIAIGKIWKNEDDNFILIGDSLRLLAAALHPNNQELQEQRRTALRQSLQRKPGFVLNVDFSLPQDNFDYATLADKVFDTYYIHFTSLAQLMEREKLNMYNLLVDDGVHRLAYACGGMVTVRYRKIDDNDEIIAWHNVEALLVARGFKVEEIIWCCESKYLTPLVASVPDEDGVIKIATHAHSSMMEAHNGAHLTGHYAHWFLKAEVMALEKVPDDCRILYWEELQARWEAVGLRPEVFTKYLTEHFVENEAPGFLQKNGWHLFDKERRITAIHARECMFFEWEIRQLEAQWKIPRETTTQAVPTTVSAMKAKRNEASARWRPALDRVTEYRACGMSKYAAIKKLHDDRHASVTHKNFDSYKSAYLVAEKKYGNTGNAT